MKNSFWFVPLGVGDAFSEKYYSSSLYICYNNYSIAVDCPHPYRKILKEAANSSKENLNLEKLNSIIITHLHSDHMSGLEGIGFYMRYIANKKLKLVAHKKVLQDLWPYHLQGSMAPLCDPPEKHRKFTDFFNPVSFNPKGEITEGPFKISSKLTRHHIPTTALKITAGDKTLGYSADTAFDEDLIEWLSSADIIIHETNTGGHTPYEKLDALPQELKHKMYLIHYPDVFNKEASTIPPLVQAKKYIL